MSSSYNGLPNNDHSDLGNLPDSDAEVLLKVSTIENTLHLIEALKASDKDLAERVQYKFQFMDTGRLAIPAVVNDLQNTGLIELTMTHEQGQPIDFSLEFHGNDSGFSLIASRSSETDPRAMVDLCAIPVNGNIDPENIRKFPISAADINRLIMSMIEVKKDGNYDNAAAYDLHDPDMLIPLITVLADKSDSYSTSASYTDLDDRGLAIHYTSSTNFDSKTDTFTITCPTNSDGSRRVVMQADLENSLRVTYYAELADCLGVDRYTLIPDVQDLRQIDGRIANALGRFQTKLLSLEDLLAAGEDSGTGDFLA